MAPDQELEEGLNQWLHNPVTQAVKQGLRRLVEESRDRWESGEFLRDKLLEAGALGYIQGLRALIDIDVEGLKGMLKDD